MQRSASLINSENAHLFTIRALRGNLPAALLDTSISYPMYLRYRPTLANRPSPAPKSITLLISARRASTCAQVSWTTVLGVSTWHRSKYRTTDSRGPQSLVRACTFVSSSIARVPRKLMPIALRYFSMAEAVPIKSSLLLVHYNELL